MKNIITIFLVCILTSSYAQDFYDMNTIQTIEITFEENNWDQLLDIEYATTGDYILAQSVMINGVEFDSVGVKYKGNSTYQSNQVKNPWHIELDTYKDHEYDGYTDIKLSNVAKDPSFLREVLSYQILRQYMDAPLSNYANVYVNGNLIGLYSNSESISKKFVDSRFYSKKGTFVKCNPPDGAGPQSNDFPNLEYLGQDSTDYYDAYEIKSDAGWQELIDLCDTLDNEIGEIEKIIDVDRAIWMLAYNNALVNLDSYSGGFKQNYYLYRDESGRFLPIIWDLNESFGRFSNTGAGNLNSTVAKQQMDHLLHENDTDFPLIRNLLSVPMYKRMYLAHFKTILIENFDNGSYFTTGQTLQGVIDASVQADNNKFFTYNNFLANLSSDINGGGGGQGGGATPGIASLMDGRNDYLLSQNDFTQVEPNINNIGLSSSDPVINEMITITAAIENENQVYLGYRTDLVDAFTRIEMFDDGAHNDGAANDGVYGMEIELTEALTQYYIYAENDDIGKFSPQRAEHEFHTILATTTDTPVGDIVINEIMASNETTVADQDGEFDDWIELYINSDVDIDLEGYYLSDDVDDLMQWTFPSGAVISSGGYLIIWADNEEEQEGLHANFKLSSVSESVFLSDASGEIIDELSYGSQETDISFGRFANGTGPFQFMDPSFNAENNGISNSVEIESQELLFEVYPNPTSGALYIQSQSEILQLGIYNLSGQKLINYDGENLVAAIDVSSLQSGVYFVRGISTDNRVGVCSLIVTK